MSTTKLEQAGVAVNAAEAELAEKERALAAEEQLLAKTKCDADQAAERARQADPFSEREFMKRAQDDTLAAAKLAAVGSRVEAVRRAVEGARDAVVAARFARDSARLEAMHAVILEERARLEQRLHQVAGEVTDELRKLHALTEEANQFAAAIPRPDVRSQVPSLAQSGLTGAAWFAARARDAAEAHDVLRQAVSATCPTPEPRPVPDELKRANAAEAAAQDRRVREMLEDIADQEAWAAGRRAALERRRALGEERRIASNENARSHDYTPRIG